MKKIVASKVQINSASGDVWCDMREQFGGEGW